MVLEVMDANNANNTVSASFRVKNRGGTSGTVGGTDSGDDTGPALEAEKGRKKCTDGLDNDGDTLVDADDPDCR